MSALEHDKKTQLTKVKLSTLIKADQHPMKLIVCARCYAKGIIYWKMLECKLTRVWNWSENSPSRTLLAHWRQQTAVLIVGIAKILQE